MDMLYDKHTVINERTAIAKYVEHARNNGPSHLSHAIHHAYSSFRQARVSVSLLTMVTPKLMCTSKYITYQWRVYIEVADHRFNTWSRL